MQEQETGATVVLFDTDLFFVVKVRTMLQHAGYAVVTARSIDDFTRKLAGDAPRLALVNTANAALDWRGAIAAARAAAIPVVAFGSHVDLETQQQARQAGATRVIANSRLATDLPGIVARTLQASTSSSGESDAAVDDETAADEHPPAHTET